LIVPAALSGLRELLLHDEVHRTLIGISAVRTLLLAELVEHVKIACKDHRHLVDYITLATPGSGGAPSVVPSLSGTPPGGTSPGGTAGATGVTGQNAAGAAPPAHGAPTEPAPSQFVTEFGDKMAAVVRMPIEQLRTTVDSHGEAIDKGAAGILELQAAKTASDARAQALEASFLRLDTAHRGLSARVAEMGFEQDEMEEATAALREAAREVEPLIIAVVEEGGNRGSGEHGRKTQARPMRQAGAPFRKAQARKKK
jgi:hypothetical protein